MAKNAAVFSKLSAFLYAIFVKIIKLAVENPNFVLKPEFA
jgi:hypothetical protein